MAITTPTLSSINEAEEALQAAWQRRDYAGAARLRATLATLWAQRRAELAALRAQTPSRDDGMTFKMRRGA